MKNTLSTCPEPGSEAAATPVQPGLAWSSSTLLKVTKYGLALVLLAAGGLALQSVFAPPPGGGLGMLVTLAVAGLLALTVFTSVFCWRAQARAAQFAVSMQQSNEKLQSANDRLHKWAFVDPLTQLPNRLLFEDRLQHAASRCDRANERAAEDGETRLAVLFIDLDHFKPINDEFGHGTGDLVLKEVALRLQQAARTSDTLARVGGDEFLLLMEDVSALHDCMMLATRLVEQLSQPFLVGERRIQISCSVGIALYPDHGTREKLIANADTAMYAAKQAGRGRYAVFRTAMNADAMEEWSLQNDLRSALELGQLELHYQPKVDGHRGRFTGAEALLRWKHPRRGYVSPAVFIPIAERFGLINTIGEWVVDEACRQLQVWADVGVRMRVAVNLSVHQLRQENLVEKIEAAIKRNWIDPSQLLCEITESVAMEDITATQQTMQSLGAIGVSLSIDDFGTGYSSLSYLRQLPAQQLKIDRSFVSDLESSSDARAIVDAVVSLAHALGLKVVAEGVETAGQRDILLGFGCDELQGYYFARPMPAEMLLDWIRGNKPEGSVDFAPSMLQDMPELDGIDEPAAPALRPEAMPLMGTLWSPTMH